MNQSSFEVIALDGELDIVRRDELAHALAITTAGPAILVDFSRVTYADSTALSQLMKFRNDAERLGRRIAIVTGNAQFVRVLQYAGLTDVFAVFDDRGEALSHLAKPS
jgi:anti-sigma B factor antagonist